MALVQFSTTDEEEQMIDDLKPVFKTTTRTKVLRGSLRKAHEIFKDVKVNV